MISWCFLSKLAGPLMKVGVSLANFVAPLATMPSASVIDGAI